MSRLLLTSWLFLLIVFALPSADARASPSPSSRKPDEESLADGDIDAEDLVGRSTLGRGVLQRSPPGGQTYLSLAGFTRKTITGEREVGGFLVVGLPLDKLARVATRASIATEPIAKPISALTTGAGAANVTTHSETEGLAGVTPKLARAAVEAAWRAAGLGNDDARLDAIVSRARWSGVLPETRLRAIRYDDSRLYGDGTTTVPVRDSAGANVGLEARLTWRFDRLLYAEDEPSFERMRLERHDARARIGGHVLEALFHWHRAWLELRWAQAASREAREPPGRPTRDEAEAALRVMEAEATLDVLTAGWFTSTRTRMFAVKPLSEGEAL